MNILVIGSGGREHALCWAIKKSPHCETLYIAPGNGGMMYLGTCVDLNTDNANDVIDFCQKHHITLVVIGPEAPLVNGLADALRAKNISTFGPSAKAAQLEGSKGFTKDLCAKYNIPTAAYGRFKDAATAISFAKEKGTPIVIKADGLAAGKGVIIAETNEESEAAILDMFDGAFGEAGAEVVVEEFLVGEEASFFAFVNGSDVLPLTSAQDHKRVGDGDVGPNTGGMGAYSPAPVMTPALTEKTLTDIIQRTADAMVSEGTPFQGVLFAGLMITDKGPELIEYNCRFGDPECQVLMMRMENDLVEAIMATVNGNLKDYQFSWSRQTALTVVMASKGYPSSYNKNTLIEGVEKANQCPDTMVFHAGTKCTDGNLFATGGRVLNVTSKGSSVKDAHEKTYTAIKQINWPNGFYRNDIGWRAIKREENAEEEL